MTSAVRDLSEICGLRVVVSGSLHDLPSTLLARSREMEVAEEPMSKELIDSFLELKYLTDFISSHNLDEPVWKVLPCCLCLILLNQFSLKPSTRMLLTVVPILKQSLKCLESRK